MDVFGLSFGLSSDTAYCIFGKSANSTSISLSSPYVAKTTGLILTPNKIRCLTPPSLSVFGLSLILKYFRLDILL